MKWKYFIAISLAAFIYPSISFAICPISSPPTSDFFNLAVFYLFSGTLGKFLYTGSLLLAWLLPIGVFSYVVWRISHEKYGFSKKTNFALVIIGSVALILFALHATTYQSLVAKYWMCAWAY